MLFLIMKSYYCLHYFNYPIFIFTITILFTVVLTSSIHEIVLTYNILLVQKTVLVGWLVEFLVSRLLQTFSSNV